MDIQPEATWADIIDGLPKHLRCAYESGGKDLLLKVIKIEVEN